MKIPECYILRCLELAQKGAGNISPNPQVGAVIVHENTIIGEGWHEEYGQGHAEVNAVASVPDHLRHLLPHSTIYVNLEPCFHYGKTPPCVDLLLKCGFKKVVIAATDPNPKVAGQSVKKLREAGVEVITDILTEESEYLNRRFNTYMLEKRPYIILKWAQTKDAYFAPSSPSKKWISNALSKKLSHQWRAIEDAIMVGTTTAAVDNPNLNVREWQGRNPIRVVLDRHLSLNSSLQIFQGPQKTVIFTAKAAPNSPKAHVSYVTIDFEQDVIPQVLQHLYTLKIQSVIVEGGKTLLEAFIAGDYWDEARVFVGTDCWREGIKAPTLPQHLCISSEAIGDNLLNVFQK